MVPIFTRQSSAARFPLRWRGYDRAEVDKFLRQTAVDRQRLQEDLAQLEAVMAGHSEARRRELERLAALRAEVASCFEKNIGALRTATEQLSSHVQSAPARPQGTCEAAKPAAAPARMRWSQPFHMCAPAWMSGRRQRALVAGVSIAGLIFTAFMYQYQPRASEISVAPVAEAGQEVSQLVASPAPIVQPVEGLVLTLTARRTCWIATTIDGGQRLERLLNPDETIMLRAHEEAVLRVGDAAALSILINNQLARPLGTSGQVVTARITQSNYLDFLANN